MMHYLKTFAFTFVLFVFINPNMATSDALITSVKKGILFSCCLGYYSFWDHVDVSIC